MGQEVTENRVSYMKSPENNILEGLCNIRGE